MTIVQINGSRFQTNTAWVVDEVQIAFAASEGGSSSWQIVAHDPDGPNAGVSTGDVTIVSWTDTQIELDVNENTVDAYAATVIVRSADGLQQVQFDLDPDQPMSSPGATLVTAGVGYNALSLFLGGGGCPANLSASYDSIVAAVITGDTTGLSGLKVDFADASSVIYDGNNSSFTSPAPSLWTAVTSDVHRKEAVGITPVDINGDPITAGISPLPDGYGCTLEVDSFTIDDNGVNISFLPALIGSAAGAFAAGVDAYMHIIGCSENGGSAFNVQFFNPNGPSSGSNDPAWVFNQWSDAGIQIDTSAAPTSIVSADIDLIDFEVVSIGSVAVELIGSPPP